MCSYVTDCPLGSASTYLIREVNDKWRGNGVWVLAIATLSRLFLLRRFELAAALDVTAFELL